MRFYLILAIVIDNLLETFKIFINFFSIFKTISRPVLLTSGDKSVQIVA